MADVQCFEMEELMHSKAAVMAVLHYLFARFDERFDGAPTLLILDEGWLFLDDPVFAGRIRQWLKTLRKKTPAVIFATQSLADISDSSIAPAIIESCASRIFLPNPKATEPQIRTIYEGFGLKRPPDRDRRHRAAQARLLLPIPPRQPPVRPRPGAGDAGALRRIHAARPARHRRGARRRCHPDAAPVRPPRLRHRGLIGPADLLPSFPTSAPSPRQPGPPQENQPCETASAARMALPHLLPCFGIQPRMRNVRRHRLDPTNLPCRTR